MVIFKSRLNQIAIFRNLTYQRLKTCLRLLSSDLKGNTVTQENGAENVATIRNIGVMAHIDAGKTTTTERILYYSGYSSHLGDVDRGDTITDYLEQERERGITIQSAAVTYYWQKHKINLIDTPGHVDFTVEVERSLRVLDGAITVLDASAGVEAQTLTVWRQADKYKVPRIIFLNKMDKLGANFSMCLNSIREKLHVEPVAVNLPIGREKTFTGVVDLLTLEQLLWDSSKCEDGKTYTSERVELEQSDTSSQTVFKSRESLIGFLADHDDTIANYVLQDMKMDDIPVEDIKNALRKLTLSHKAVIVLCGSAKKNIGVQPLMDAVVDFLPSPLDVPMDFVQYYGTDLCALAFKIVHDPHKGALTYVRIYSGVLQAGSSIYNLNLHINEKLGNHDLLQVYADDYKAVKRATAGNIVCIAHLTQTRTGDTLTANIKSARDAAARRGTSNLEESEEEELMLAGVEVPSPVFFCSIEAPSTSKQRDMEKALERLQREDPSLKVDTDKNTGQLVLSGMGELHLDIVKNRLLTELKVEAYLGPLQIAYKEMLGEPVEHTCCLENTIGKTLNSVTMAVTLTQNEKAPVFKSVTYSPDVVVKSYKYRHSIDNGVKSALNAGPLLHSPVMNVDVNINSLVMEARTSHHFLQAAANQCVSEALQKAQCYLMEPVMNVEVHTDTTYLHLVHSDLVRRRGDISKMLHQNEARTIHALVPLADLVGYATDLRTMTSGTASFTMELDHYSRLSLQQQNKVINSMVSY